MNKDFQLILGTIGLEHRANIPYEHVMNGLVERLNRTLLTKARKMLFLTKARKMLFNANLNVRWWCEAVSMANIYQPPR